MDILQPTNWRDWLALLLITALGIAALVGLLPLAARYPFIVAPAVYDRFTPIKKPFTGMMNFTSVVVGLVVVTLCVLLYCGWRSWELSRPIRVSAPRRRGSERPREG